MVTLYIWGQKLKIICINLFLFCKILMAANQKVCFSLKRHANELHVDITISKGARMSTFLAVSTFMSTCFSLFIARTK